MIDQTKLRFFEAFRFVSIAHAGQFRCGPDFRPYTVHLLDVATLLAENVLTYNDNLIIRGLQDDFIEDDNNVIIAGLLHDVLEDTKYTLTDIRKFFGSDIATLVYECTDPPLKCGEARKQAQIKRMKSISNRAKIIKLADKTANLRDIVAHPPGWTSGKIEEYILFASKIGSAASGLCLDLDEKFQSALSAARATLSPPPPADDVDLGLAKQQSFEAATKDAAAYGAGYLLDGEYIDALDVVKALALEVDDGQ